MARLFSTVFVTSKGRRAMPAFPIPLSRLLAGVALVLPGPARAAIVHIVPPEAIRIPFGDSVGIDLNGDGIDDLRFSNNFQDNHAIPVLGSRVIANALLPQQVAFSASNLDAETWIGNGVSTGNVWTDHQASLASCANNGGVTCIGNFVDGRGYLGVEFQINGEPHYGWMGILPGDGFAIRMDIVDWSYESLPQTPLRAGQIPEPSGALLVLGTLLLMAVRRAR